MTERGAANVRRRPHALRIRAKRATLGRSDAAGRHRRSDRAMAAAPLRPVARDATRPVRRAPSSGCSRAASLAADRAARQRGSGVQPAGLALAGRRHVDCATTAIAGWRKTSTPGPGRGPATHGDPGVLRRRGPRGRRCAARAVVRRRRWFATPRNAAEVTLPRTPWGIERPTRADAAGMARCSRRSRTDRSTRAPWWPPQLEGRPALSIHESLSLRRFRQGWCECCCRSACRGASRAPARDRRVSWFASPRTRRLRAGWRGARGAQTLEQLERPEDLLAHARNAPPAAHRPGAGCAHPR